MKTNCQSLEMDNKILSQNIPLLTVIIPVYKVEKYLEKCLNSVINQTYTNLQIICVDDGSPDNCGTILDKFALNDSRIKVVHKENAGASSARNIALDLMLQSNREKLVNNSEFITFIDADDYIEEDAFSQAISKFDENIDLVCFGFERVNDSGIPANKSSLCNPHAFGKRGCLSLNSDLVDNLNYYPFFKVYRTRIILDNNIRFPDIKFFEDSYFSFMSLLFCRNVYLENKYPYKYIQRESSTSGTAKKRPDGCAFNFIYVYSYALEFLKGHGMFEAYNNYFWILFYKMVYWAIEIAESPDVELEIYNKAKKTLEEEFIACSSVKHDHFNQLIDKRKFKEANLYKFANLVKIKHRANYDKIYFCGLPLFKIEYTEYFKVLTILGFFKLRCSFKREL